MATFNMNLQVPTPGVTPGPQYAQDLQSCFNVIDAHDHSQGNGSPISFNSIQVTQDFDLLSNALLSAKGLQFTNQTVVPGFATLSMKSNNLHWSNGTGAFNFDITTGPSINFSGNIGFPGLPYGTASASFIPDIILPALGTFKFESSTGVAANTSCGPLKIRDVAAGSSYIQIVPPLGLVNDYSIDLFNGLPVSTKIVSLNSAGQLAANYTVDNTTIQISTNTLQVKDGAITNAKLAPGITAPAGTVTAANRLVGNNKFGSNFSYASTGPVTLSTITITTSAANKFILMTSYNNALNGSGYGGSGAGLSELFMWFTIEGPSLAETLVGSVNNIGSLKQRAITLPYFCINQGTYTIRFKAQCFFNGGATIEVNNEKLWASEIG
jgi:hypothetical protein